VTRLDVDLIQGFAIARPMPMPALVEWLTEREAPLIG
jgi:EAL domain-containing protein (putative c-di-GMP-specific phosphodiesterase class I)